VVYCTGLENRRSERIRGFESHSLRTIAFGVSRLAFKTVQTGSEPGAYTGFWPQSKEAMLRHSCGFWKGQRLHRQDIIESRSSDARTNSYTVTEGKHDAKRQVALV
jgi:hypothetical protein